MCTNMSETFRCLNPPPIDGFRQDLDCNDKCPGYIPKPMRGYNGLECVCPVCNGTAIADTVDIGVGYEQCEPFHCECGWIQGDHDIITYKNED